jgi:3-hydroxyisobutyrate dehydrogenase-like beta-hydroxyacid dehydrogenase
MNITIKTRNSSGGELDAHQVDMTTINPEDTSEVSEAIKDAIMEILAGAVIEPGDSITVEAS